MKRRASPFNGFRKLGRRGGAPIAPPIITQTAAPTFGPYTAGQTPAGVYTAGTYASSAGTISSAVPQWTINGVSQPGSTVLAEGNVVGLSILVTDSAANQRTFGYGTAAPAGAAAGGTTLPEITGSNVAQSLAGLAVTVGVNEAGGTLFWIITTNVAPSESDVLGGAGVYSGNQAVPSIVAPIAFGGTVTLDFGTQYYFAAVYQNGLGNSALSVTPFVPDSIALDGTFSEDWRRFSLGENNLDFAAKGYTVSGAAAPIWSIVDNDPGAPVQRALQLETSTTAAKDLTVNPVSAAIADALNGDFTRIDIRMRLDFNLTNTIRFGFGLISAGVASGLIIRGNSTTVEFAAVENTGIRTGAITPFFTAPSRTTLNTQTWDVRIEITPADMKFKIWDISGSEPGSWMATIVPTSQFGWLIDDAGEPLAWPFGFSGMLNSAAPQFFRNVLWYSVGFDKNAPNLGV